MATLLVMAAVVAATLVERAPTVAAELAVDIAAALALAADTAAVVMPVADSAAVATVADLVAAEAMLAVAAAMVVAVVQTGGMSAASTRRPVCFGRRAFCLCAKADAKIGRHMILPACGFQRDSRNYRHFESLFGPKTREK